MNSYSTSQCPICRRSYGYFPRACQMLDSLLHKILPEEYLRREREVQAFETERQVWSSPLIGDTFPRSEEGIAPMTSTLVSELLPVDNHSGSDRNHTPICLIGINIVTDDVVRSAHTSDATLPSITQSSANNVDTGSGSPAICDNTSFDDALMSLKILPVSVEDGPKEHSPEQYGHVVGSSCKISSTLEEGDPPQPLFLKDNSIFKQLSDVSQVEEVGCSGSQSIVSISDALCGVCHQLLCQPVVPMCGHVFCQSCVRYSQDRKLICPTCRSPHHEEHLDVCLELHFYLQRTFPNKYKERLQATAESANPPQMTAISKQSSNKNGRQEPCVDTRGPPRAGIGCDGCGMFPIYGLTFFHCKNCPRIGYDLCENCYAIGPDLPGRFNQHHTRDHTMIEIPLPTSFWLETDSLIIAHLLPEDLHDSE